MALFTDSERPVAEALAGIGYCNPFLPERVALERKSLGSRYRPNPDVVQWRPGVVDSESSNVPLLRETAQRLAETARQRLVDQQECSEQELRIYEDLVLFLLYARHMLELDEWVLKPTSDSSIVREAWRNFSKDFTHFLQLPKRPLPSNHNVLHAFAVLVQLHRAFMSIYECIIGSSMAIARLRADVWRSIFTHDMRRYSRTLHRCMADIPTLILGPSGTGKELVARAIGHSRYLTFNPDNESFAAKDLGDFHPLNLSALSPTLIESELFGHRRGAFSGATSDHAGWLETCGTSGTVFLDEIGDLESSIQVKILRVLQSRSFQRVGETTARTFHGKIVAATNRDLADEMQSGRFREDLYFRLCADIVHTPTLKEQLSESPDDLETLVTFLAGRIIPEDPDESATLAKEVIDWIKDHLPANYDWPGNIRELEQCVRNVMIRGTYHPRIATKTSSNARDRLAGLVADGLLTLDELICHYTSFACATHGSYIAAGEKLGINWRTIRDRLDPKLVEQYRSDSLQQ